MSIPNLVLRGALLAAALAATPAFAGDATKGAIAFKTKCQICHSVTAGQKAIMAPNLLKAVGRKAGSTDYAMYSPQLKAFGKVWTAALLDTWLESPAKLVPGTRMSINVPSQADRDDIVAYLVTLGK